MKDVAEALDRVLSHVGTVLRYIAPGFAALLIVAAVTPRSSAFLLSGSWAVLVLGVLLGFAIYGVIRSAFTRLLWYPFVRARRLKDSSTMRKNLTTWKSIALLQNLTVWETMRELDSQRWLRRAGDDKAKAMQSEMDRWSEILNFLYCLGPEMIVIPLVAPGAQLSGWCVKTHSNIVLIGGFVVLVAALLSEYWITEKEFELRDRYPDGRDPTSP